MTVIVYRDGVIAGDTAMYSQNTIFGHRAKIGIRNGWLYGSAGNPDVGYQLVRWIDTLPEGYDPPDVPAFPVTFSDKSESGALLVAPGGTLYTVDYASPHPVRFHAEFAAIGCGEDFAYGALAMGATAVEAVQVAITHCSHCAGRAVWIDRDGNRDTELFPDKKIYRVVNSS